MGFDIKPLDLYATSASFYISDGNRKTKLQRHSKSYQSQFGAVMTLCVQTMCLAYLTNMIVRMYTLEDDNYNALA